MNNRLKELMLEAGYAEPEMIDRAQRFAELIIQECVEVVRDINQEYDGGSTVVNAADEIKEHFGIK